METREKPGDASVVFSRNENGKLPKRPLVFKPNDLIEKFICSSAPGGQNVNKVATCVFLKHLPTGISVKCQSERTQGANRNLARKILLEKIGNLAKQQSLLKQSEHFKKIKQNARRTTGQKARMLDKKHRHAQKKASRGKIREIDIA